MSNAQRRGVGRTEVLNRESGTPALARWRGTAWPLILASAAGGDARAQDLAADSIPAELQAPVNSWLNTSATASYEDKEDFESERKTLQFTVKDTIGFSDERFNLDFYVKLLSVDYSMDGCRNPGDYINHRQPSVSETYEDYFLPQIGLVYRIDSRNQIFASYSENMAFPRGADDVFAAASPAAPAPSPERAKNVALGIRGNHSTFNASLAGYFTRFDDRLQSFSSPVPGSTTNETFFQNVGAVDAYGVESSGQWKPQRLGGRIYFNANVDYNVLKFTDNYASLDISGNDVPNFPRWVVQSGITAEPATWAPVNVSARYLGKRYSAFTNEEHIGGYTLFNAYIDLGGGFFRPGPDRTVQFTLTATL